MSRPSLISLCLAVAGLLIAAAAPASAAGATASTSVKVSVPASTKPGKLTAVTLTLPGNVAAVDGRLLIAKGAAELIGVAPVSGGKGLMPEKVTGGYAFGAYALGTHAGQVVIQLVVNPLKAGKLQVRVRIDSTADKAGTRIGSTSDVAASVGVRGGSRVLAAPSASAVPSFSPSQPAVGVRKLVGYGKINTQDLDTTRAAWYEARAQGTVCGSSVTGDANGDGCVDIVDLQAVKAAIGTRAVNAVQPKQPAATTLAAIPGLTFTVNSTGDTVDANIGNGICADSQGKCTLRAAMQEADWHKGDDRIEFNIPGGVPAVIQVNSSLPIITSKNGTLTIDGTTQPGSAVNTAAVSSNAVIGVEVRGSGSGSSQVAFYFTSYNNTIRGLAITNFWRGIMLDGVNAHDNLIAGNWIGMHANGTNGTGGDKGVLINTGASNNHVGTPALADRNLIGSVAKGVDEYGPGTNSNVIQNNVLCILPNGSAATCSTGMDHDFGPKNDLIGGNGPNELNVVGPTSLQAVEFSHGWNPNLPWGTDTATTYQIDNNRVIGNWLGFRADGSYDANFRSGLVGGGDNGNGINVYDGSNDNLIANNFIASYFDGVQSMAPNAKRNEFRNNTIGVSPLGQAAPLTGWGVRLRWNAQYDIVDGNTIRNAASGGVGLTQNTVYNIVISQNIISDTSGPAIYLAPDPAHAGQGANMLLAGPPITGATTAAVTGTGIVGATVEVYQASRAAGGSNKGLPVAYLGSAVVGANGKWTVPVSGLNVGDRVTALQTRTSDSTTSDLSVNVAVVSAGVTDPRVAADDFQRTSASGWGNAVVGGAWTVSDTAAAYTLNGSVGRMDVPAGLVRYATLSPDVPAANVTITGTVNFDRLPVGGNVFAYVDARQTGKNAYRAQIRMTTAGLVYVQLRKSIGGTETAVAAEVSTGITATASTVLAYRFTIVGGHLQERVWDATTAEPSTWQTVADDSTITAAGGVALRAYTGSAVSNGPVGVNFDNFLANPAP